MTNTSMGESPFWEHRDLRKRCYRVNTLRKTDTSPEIMVYIPSFPFGFRPIFRGELFVLGSLTSIWVPSYLQQRFWMILHIQGLLVNLGDVFLLRTWKVCMLPAVPYTVKLERMSSTDIQTLWCKCAVYILWLLRACEHVISYRRVFKCIIDELLQLHHAWFAHSFAHMLTFFNKKCCMGIDDTS